jgi:hypothetical protein
MQSTDTLLVPAPIAGAMLTKAEAIAWLGGPLGEARASDQASRSDDGRPRLSSCAWFPPGYDAAVAEAPPERGLCLTLMAMPSVAAARERFAVMSSGVPGAPPVHGTPVKGVADQAVLERVKLPPGAEVARLKFRHGDVAGSVQVWSRAGDPAAIARTVADHVVARLR